MKSEDSLKQFKRKTTSIKLYPCQEKSLQQGFAIPQPVKYLSPKSINGLKNCFYNNQQSIIKTLQQEVNQLKKQVNALKREKQQFSQENNLFKKIIQQHSEREKTNQHYQFATQNVLNQLKQKIQLMSQDDQLSTYDDIDIGDICNCQNYQKQIKCFQVKVKFLQESLLHSQQIIIKLKQQNAKNKESLAKIEHKIRLKKISADSQLSKEKEKTKYKMCSIKQDIDDGQQ